MVGERKVGILGLGVTLVALAGTPVLAQTASRHSMVEGGVGWAAFIDESPINHAVFSGSGRWFLTPRLAVGPEVTFMRGPGDDRDWFLTGNATFDLPKAAPRRVTPYLVIGGGLMWHTDRVGTGLYTSSEGALTGGIGARISAGRDWFVAPEARLGWEGHWRVSATIGKTIARKGPQRSSPGA